MERVKELENYIGKKITIFYQAFGSGTFLGTLQNAFKNDKGEYIIDIIPYRSQKAKRINLKTTDFVIYEGYRHLYFARGGMGLPKYEYFKKISTYEYPIIFKNCEIEGIMYEGYAIIKEKDNDRYNIMINDGCYSFDTIEDGKKYINDFKIEEEKYIQEWRKRNIV